MSKKKSILDNGKRQRISDRVLILTLFVQILILINQSVGLYAVAAQSMQASMIEPTGETLEVHIFTDTGRLNLVENLIKRVRDWATTWYVGGSTKVNATTGITITVTGSNVGSIASVNYYIEARDSTGAGQPYRFLAGNGSSVSVGGSSLQVSNQTSIENHLTAMGLSTTEGHTIDYYLYVAAQVTGAVSGDTLTSEIPYTKFDSVTYNYGSIVTENIAPAQDTYVWQGSPGSDYSTSGEVRIRANSGGADYQTFMSFNLTNYNDVQEATLYLYLYDWSWNPNCQVRLASCQPWSSPITWNTKPAYIGTITYISFTMPGAGYNYKSWRDASAYIKGKSGQMAYYWLYSTSGQDEDLRFRAQEHTGTAYDPYLAVKYMGYSASWYPLPPLSLAELPITIDVIALTALIIATVLAFRENRRKNR